MPLPAVSERNDQWRAQTPYTWAVAVIFFLISESLILLAERKGLLGTSFLLRWMLPPLATSPLTMGIGFARAIRKCSKDPGCDEIATLAVAGIAIVELMGYTVLTAVLTRLF